MSSAAVAGVTWRLTTPLARARISTTRASAVSRISGCSTGARPLGFAACSAGARCQTRWNSSFAPRRGKGVEPTTADEMDEMDETTRKEEPRPQGGEEQQQEVAEGKYAEPDSAGTAHPNTVQTKSMVKLQEDQVSKDEPIPKHKLNPRTPRNTNGKEPSMTEGATQGDSSDTSTKSSSSSSSTPDTESLGPKTRQVRDEAKQSGPLEAVLHMEPPAQVAKQHPTMAAKPYVHHFDSYSLVRELQDGGYSKNQAIESMKGIRALLAQNLDVAQESLVSKSDVENESYLFRAACSELGQEIKNNRRLQDEQLRQQRTLLQHEVDILTQSLNQEVLSLNDNVRGMFNDRRMAVREEQKTADSDVQQINYKISTSLVSDSKSEIEGVRWILIRRSVMGIFFMAMLTLATVRYATYLLNERRKEAAREQEERERVRRDGGKRDNSSAADAAVILSAN